MKCPTCQTGFNPENATFEESPDYSNRDDESGCNLYFGNCPECGQFIVKIQEGFMAGGQTVMVQSSEVIFPKSSSRFVEPEVPKEIREDFIEAASILSLSPKASAALSRRLLQHILRDKFGFSRPNLAQEIDDFLKLKDVPSYLSDGIDAIRIVGNLAAHPLKDTNTGMIVEVEPGEAEWILDVLEMLFDFAYVQPERHKQNRAALNKKLAALGKPPMK